LVGGLRPSVAAKAQDVKFLYAPGGNHHGEFVVQGATFAPNGYVDLVPGPFDSLPSRRWFARRVVDLAGTGALFGPAGWRFADHPVALTAYLVFAATMVALALIDLDVHRLPNVIVAPAYPVLAVLRAIGADGGPLVRAVWETALLFTFFLLVALVPPGAMGFGDVKLPESWADDRLPLLGRVPDCSVRVLPPGCRHGPRSDRRRPGGA
jgi:hypothetical protein